jgi:hypothetical protein
MSGEILHQLDPTITQPFQANGDGHALPIQDATAALATPAPHSHEINPFLPKVALSLALPRGAEPLYPSKHRQIVEEGNMEYARVIASQVKIGEARANTLRYSIIRDDTEYGNEFFACMDHPALAHHGHHHSRHVEALQKQAIKSYVLEKGRGLFTIPYAQEDIDSAMLFPYLHDIDQQSAAFRNITEEEGKLKEKRGHGIGAAVMTMAMTSRYSEVNNIDINQAWRITKTASIMMMRHDIPERFDRTFNPQNTRAELFKDKPIEDLVAAFENDTLDLFSLSPRQAIDILKSIKAKHGFMSDGKSIYGLSPAFEKEFAAELEILSRSEDPLFKDLLPSRRKRLLVLTEAANSFSKAGESPYILLPSDIKPCFAFMDFRISIACRGDRENKSNVSFSKAATKSSIGLSLNSSALVFCGLNVRSNRSGISCRIIMIDAVLVIRQA